MGSSTLQNLLLLHVRVCKILWLAMTGAVFMYPAVAYFLTARADAPQAVSPILPAALALAAIALAIVAQKIPNRMLSDEKLRELWLREPNLSLYARNPRTGQPDPQRAAELEGLSKQEKKFFLLSAAYVTPYVLRLALNDGIAIVGLVWSFQTHVFWPALVLALVAFALNALAYPRLEALFDRALRMGM